MLYIDLNELRKTNKLISQEFIGPDEFDLDRFGIDLKSSVGIKLEISHSGIDDLLLEGTVETDLEQKCRKCLNPVASTLSASLELLFKSKHSLEKNDEIDDGLQFDWKQGKVDLMDHLSQEIVLNALSFVECRNPCLGICAGCGEHLNDSVCVCPEQPIDPRWDVLLNN